MLPSHGMAAHRCARCDLILSFPDLRRCSYCGTNGEAPDYYCFKCDVKGCESLECAEHGSCWYHHLPRDPLMGRRHIPVDPVAELFISTVTYSEDDAAKQKKLHDRDRRNQWFSVCYDSDEGMTDEREPRLKPWLSVTDRFRALCDPGQIGNRYSSSQYPSFVSFIGDTGVGKSTLLRAVMMMGQLNISAKSQTEDAQIRKKLLEAISQGPVTRSAHRDHLTQSTTAGVHLYKDTTTYQSNPNHSSSPQADGQGIISLDSSKPILLVDCEGFRGSVCLTNSSHSLNAFRNGQIETQPPEQQLYPENEYEISYQPITARSIRSKEGKEGAEIFYARVLYALSDVLVFVTSSDQMLHGDLQRLLEWAAGAVHQTVNHAVNKTLLVVRNMPEHHDAAYYDDAELGKSLFNGLEPLWEGSPILRDFRKSHNSSTQDGVMRIQTNKDLFGKFFKNYEACYVPSTSKSKIEDIYKQYVQLRQKIVKASEISQEIRQRSWTQYNIPTLTHLLKRAFGHYRVSDQPFDFFLAARRDNPAPTSHVDHFANWVKHCWKWRKKPGLLSEVVALSLVIYVLRNFQCQPLDPGVYFERELENFCRESLLRYGDKFLNCGYRFKDSSQGGCIAKRPVHIEHCSRDGTRSPGDFVDEMADYRDTIMKEIKNFFYEHFLRMCPREAPFLPRPRDVRQQREDILRKYTDRFRHIKSLSTCFVCTYEIPDHVLPCGHSYCDYCIQEFGTPSQDFEYCFSLSRCLLCQASFDFRSPKFYLKPPAAGARVLTLDGGGIRGIVELTILEEIAKRISYVLGDEVSIRQFFDLMMGTSTGGIIALGLAMRGDLKISEMKDVFVKLSLTTFETRRGGKAVTRLDPRQIIAKTLLLFRVTKSIYKTKPLRQGLQNLLSAERKLFSGAPSFLEPRFNRVAVTAAKDDTANPCIITNYNRSRILDTTTINDVDWETQLGPASKDSVNADFEREDQDEKEMKAWEAALATSAAPYYFKPYIKPETDTDYVDGALHANLPIECSLRELKNIWPSLGAAPPDVLVSIGTGMQKNELPFPDSLDIGGLRRVVKMFHQNLDTGRLWENFVRKHQTDVSLLSRIHRLNIDILGDYVALDAFKSMPTLEKMVHEQIAQPKSRLNQRIRTVTSILLANLFFLEIESLDTARQGLQEVHTLRGSIRCRLSRAGVPLMQLVNHVLYFAHAEQATGARGDLDSGAWTVVPLTDKLRAAVRGNDEWFRLPVTVSIYEEQSAKQVFAVVLKKDDPPIPISGFPVTLGELRRRTKVNRG